MSIQIKVPAMGESVTEATIARWLKKEGDSVQQDEPLVELETDKVTIEVPAPAAGVLSEIAAKNGDTVAVGALLSDGTLHDPVARLWAQAERIRAYAIDRRPGDAKRREARRSTHAL